MAVVITTYFDGTYFDVYNVASTAAADLTVTIPHGFGEIPRLITLEPLLANFYVSNWRIAAVNTTNVVIRKGVTTGSANAAAQLRVNVALPHSIFR